MRLKLGKNKMATLMMGSGALLVLTVSLISWIANRTGVTDPHVSVVTRTTVDAAADRRQIGYQAFGRALNGEVATTAERVRDASAVATAASLLIANELGKRRVPADANQLIHALLQGGLLPGLAAGATPGTLVSAHGTLTVRYRREPVGIEVLSLGNNRKAGQAILVRVPATEGISDAAIWLADSLDEVSIPQPFSPSEQLMAAHWEPLPPIQ